MGIWTAAWLAALAAATPVAWVEAHEARIEVGEVRTLRFAAPVSLVEEVGPVRAERLDDRTYFVSATTSGPGYLRFRAGRDYEVEWRITAVPPAPLPLRTPPAPRQLRERKGAPAGPPSRTEDAGLSAAPPPALPPAPPRPVAEARLILPEDTAPPADTEPAPRAARFTRLPDTLILAAARGSEGEDVSALADILATPEEIERFRLGLELIERSTYPQAAEEFRKILDANPRSPLAPLVHLKIGDALAAQAAEAETEGLRLKGTRLIPESNERFAEAAAGYTAAAGAYQAAFDAQGGEPIKDDALFRRAEAMRAARRVENETGTTPARDPSVLVAYLRIVHTMPRSPLVDDARLGIARSEEELGNALLAVGREEEARRAFERALAEYEVVAALPNASAAPAARFARARLFDENLLVRDFAKAVEEYEAYATLPGAREAEAARARAAYLRDNYL